MIMYHEPRNLLLRWIGDVGHDQPDLVKQRLRSCFFTSKAPLVAGAINTIAVATVAYLRSDYPVFAAIALADLLLLVVRVALLRRVNSPSGPIFATGLLWAGLQGATIAFVVTTADVAMSIVALASGLAAIGGIIGRNFPARRYALMQVLIIDLSYKISFSIIHQEFILLILIQTVMFFFMNWSILNQNRAATIRSILGEIESRRQSITDPLTGLVNRRGLEEKFYALRAVAQHQTLFYLDLDGFKQVNDRLGHAVGDMVLREVARRLRETVKPTDTICRLGGDEFLLLTDQIEHGGVLQLGNQIIGAIAEPYYINDFVSAKVGTSIGISGDQLNFSADLSTIMQQADQALYHSKASGKGCCTIFDNSFNILENVA